MVFKMGRDDGAIIWQNRLNNTEANQSDFAQKIAFDNNANIIVGGSSEGLNTSADIFTVKFSPTGAILWQKRYNYNTTREDRFSNLLCDEAGNVYVGGYSYRDGSNIMDMVILKYGSNGAFDWSKIQLGYTAFDRLSSIHLDQAGNLVASGQLTPSNTESDILVVKYGSTIGIQQISGEVPSKFELHQNYPNPFNPVTNIKFSIPNAGNVKLKVFDITGREAAELVNKHLSASTYSYDFDASLFSSGIYFYRIDAEGFTQVKKMILVK